VLLTAIAHHTLSCVRLKLWPSKNAILPRPRAAPLLRLNLRSFEISAVGKGPSGRSGAFLTPSPPGESVTRRDPRHPRYRKKRMWDFLLLIHRARGAIKFVAGQAAAIAFN